MKDFIKRNVAIILAFALPIILLVTVALVTYIPSALLKTDYDFVYASCNNGTDYYNYSYQFSCDKYLNESLVVENGRLIIKQVDQVRDINQDGVKEVIGSYTSRIFYHDTEKNESRELTKEEAQSLRLSSLLTSPDGVSVTGGVGTNVAVFPFIDGRSSYGYFLTKGDSKSKLNLINVNNDYYNRDFHFVGWVLPSRNN